MAEQGGGARRAHPAKKITKTSTLFTAALLRAAIDLGLDTFVSIPPGRAGGRQEALGNVKVLRKRFWFYGFAAVVAAFAFASGPAQAHGDIVSVKDSYMPGTIVIRTNERRSLLLCRYRRSDPLSGRRRPRRYAMVRHRLHRRQVYQTGVVSPRIDPA